MSIDIVYAPGGGIPRATVGTYPTLEAALSAIEAARDGRAYCVVEDDNGCLDYDRLGWSDILNYAMDHPWLELRYWPDNDGRDRSSDPLVIDQCAGWPFSLRCPEFQFGFNLRAGSELHRRIMAVLEPAR